MNAFFVLALVTSGGRLYLCLFLVKVRRVAKKVIGCMFCPVLVVDGNVNAVGLEGLVMPV